MPPQPPDEDVPARKLPAGATLLSWLEPVAPYYLGSDYMKMMTRAEVDVLREVPITDEEWERLGSIGRSNLGHPWFRIKES